MGKQRLPIRRYTQSDVEAAIEIADKLSVAEIEKLVRRFCLHDRIFDWCLAIVMGFTLWVSKAKESMINLPLWDGEYIAVPPTLLMLFSVYVILIIRHGRISLGMTLAIAHGIASERARRAAAAENAESQNASK